MQSKGAGGTPDRVAALLAAVLLLAALTFGGGSRGAGDFIAHLAALPVLALGIGRWRHVDASRLQRGFLYLLLAAIALIALQLLPLPAALFGQLPQRAAVLGDLRSAGIEPAWLPMTLDRWGTVRALLALTTFAAMWLLASTLGQIARQRLLKLALAAGVVISLLGFAQAAAGTHSSLRFYDYHHPIGAIGTFANRNHFAVLLAMLLPLGFSMGGIGQRDRAPAWIAFGYGSAVVLLLAAALSYSRAGFALACLAVLASMLVLRPAARMTESNGRGRHLGPLLAVTAAVLGIAYYAWDGIVRRLEQDPLADLRWQYLEHGIDLVRAYLPWGSGLGSFRDAYAPFEPVGDMVQVHALHAHNDFLQIAAEAGLPGLLLALAAVGLLATAAVQVMARGRMDTHPYARAAAIAVFLPLAHSLVDYPLRTLAVSVVLGLLAAEVMAAARRGEGVSSTAMHRGYVQLPGGH